MFNEVIFNVRPYKTLVMLDEAHVRICQYDDDEATGEVQESQGREGSTKDGGVYRYLAPFVHQVGVLQRFGSLEMEMKFQLTSLNVVLFCVLT